MTDDDAGVGGGVAVAGGEGGGAAGGAGGGSAGGTAGGSAGGTAGGSAGGTAGRISNTTAAAAFTAFGPSWASYTTNPTIALDTGTVDMGYHADPVQPRIASFATTTTGYSWSVSSGFVGCQLYDVGAKTFTPILTASGSVSKPFFQGQSFVLLCTSSKGPGRGSAVWSYVP